MKNQNSIPVIFTVRSILVSCLKSEFVSANHKIMDLLRMHRQLKIFSG